MLDWYYDTGTKGANGRQCKNIEYLGEVGRVGRELEREIIHPKSTVARNDMHHNAIAIEKGSVGASTRRKGSIGLHFMVWKRFFIKFQGQAPSHTGLTDPNGGGGGREKTSQPRSILVSHVK